MAEQYPIVDIDGVKYVQPLENYPVKYYEPPSPDNLKAYVKLIKSFKKRFFRNIDLGHQILMVRDIDKYIENKRTAYDTAEGTEKELEGALLSSALERRIIDCSLDHIRLRIDKSGKERTSDPIKQEKLRVLKEGINHDFMEIQNLPVLRLSRGQPDTDGVLGEMRGEPFKIFAATLTKDPRVIDFVFQGRYLKTARAMECIDQIAKSVSQLAGRGTAFRGQHMQQPITELALAAKERIQLQRSDPDFRAADNSLRSIRNNLQDRLRVGQETPPASLPRDRKSKELMDPLALLLAREAVNLMYDVAVTHEAQPKRARELAKSIEQYVDIMGQQQTSSVVRG